MAMYTNKSVLKGEGPGFSSGPQVAFQYLQGRYMSKRHKIVAYLRDKIFIPFAIANGFWKKTDKGRELILPEFVWDQKLDLVEDTAKKQYVMQLRDRLQVSARTLYETLGMDAKQEIKRLGEERGTPIDPVEIEKYKKQGAMDSATQLEKKLPGVDKDPSVQQEIVKQTLTPSKEPSGSAPKAPSDESKIKAPNTPGQKEGAKANFLKVSRASLFASEEV